MTGKQVEETGARGKALVNLRYGIRQSAQLARQLAADLIVGNEALALLGRLDAINAELDSLASATAADPRRAHNDPFWSDPPNPFPQRGASHAGI